MPAKSKSQQRFFGMVDAYKKGELKDPSKEVKDAAKGMTKKEVKDFAETKHKGLPEKVKKKKTVKITEQTLRQIVAESVRSILRENQETDIRKSFIHFIEKHEGGVLLQMIVDYESGNEFGSPVSPLPALISEYEECVLGGKKCTTEMRKEIRAAYNEWWYYAQDQLMPDEEQ